MGALVVDVVTEAGEERDEVLLELEAGVVGRHVHEIVDLEEVAAEEARQDELARLEAEKRRAAAYAREQEMRALTQENRAKVVLAEAEIPKAIAEAFRAGQLGIMDYYKLKNIEADTTMRDSISKGTQRPTDRPGSKDKEK